MKILCICAGGNVRSRAFAHRLLYELGHDALSASHDKQSEATFTMLCDWAERIIVVQPEYLGRIRPVYRPKAKVLDVGPDVYGSCWHFVLQAKVRDLLDPWAAKGFPL